MTKSLTRRGDDPDVVAGAGLDTSSVAVIVVRAA
jgi:hypothetical protein